MVSITFYVQKTEPWETEKSNNVEESEEEEEEEKARKKRKNPKRVRLIDGTLYRMNQYGKYFKMQLKVKEWTKVKYEPYDLKSVCVVTRPAYLIQRLVNFTYCKSFLIGAVSDAESPYLTELLYSQRIYQSKEKTSFIWIVWINNLSRYNGGFQ